LKKIHTKRIYEPPAASDGTRILVDRLWPRGVARGEARIDTWIKDVAPSDALRRWYSYDPKNGRSSAPAISPNCSKIQPPPNTRWRENKNNHVVIREARIISNNATVCRISLRRRGCG
jgi:hypothetical protein